MLIDFPSPGPGFCLVTPLFFCSKVLKKEKKLSESIKSYYLQPSFFLVCVDGTLSGGINHEGINHYNSLIDELIKHGDQLQASCVE